MLQYFSIGSGSSGNCAFFGTDRARILIDAGISGKRTLEALASKDVSISDIDGIFITHEHRDHISCLGVLLRKYEIPVYANRETIQAIKDSDSIGEVDWDLFNVIDDAVAVGDILVEAVPISHDAANPLAFIVNCEKSRVGHVTDLGKYDETLIKRLSGLSGLVVEANHDLRMLETGIYPYHLKRRVSGEFGHLSNEDCGKFISEILHDDLEFIVLAHLSKENNYDKLALESVELEINLSENDYRSKDFPIHIAPRSVAGEIFTLV